MDAACRSPRLRARPPASGTSIRAIRRIADTSRRSCWARTGRWTSGGLPRTASLASLRHPQNPGRAGSPTKRTSPSTARVRHPRGAGGVCLPLLRRPRRKFPRRSSWTSRVEDMALLSSSFYSIQCGHNRRPGCPPAGGAGKSCGTWRSITTPRSSWPIKVQPHRTGGGGLGRAAKASGAPGDAGIYRGLRHEQLGATPAGSAGMVVFENGRPLKKRLQAVRHPGCRRAGRLRLHAGGAPPPVHPLSRTAIAAFSRLPDLILLDGGKGHVNGRPAGAG